MNPLTDVKAEFWADLQRDMATNLSAMYLANQRLEDVISTNGRKVHRPILSHSLVQTYVPYSDLQFARKKSEKQTLEVDTPLAASDEIDDTDASQTPYGLTSHSLQSIREGLLQATEQKFLSEIPNAYHAIANASAVELDPSNILSVFQEANSKLGSVDAPTNTRLRAAVFGPITVAMLRTAKAERETGLGDQTLSNGEVGPWKGYTVVENNNLPWSASLDMSTNRTNGQTITIVGKVITFRDTLTGSGAEVLIGANAAATRDNLNALLTGGAGAGTTYTDFDLMTGYIIRRKRAIKATTTATMAFTGFGDIVVDSSFDGWSNRRQQAMFTVRGSIDLVMQFMNLEVTRKEKGHADLVKGLVNIGTKMFTDGALLTVRVNVNADGWK